MWDTVRQIGLLLVVCLGAVALVVGFGAAFNGTDAYPDADAMDDDYVAHVGETVHLWGEVTGTEGGRVVVAVDTLSIRVSNPPPEAVAVGDRVQVYGTLAPDRRFDTAAYHVQTHGEIRNMYLISIVGTALAAGAFLRRWRVDVEKRAFVPREED